MVANQSRAHLSWSFDHVVGAINLGTMNDPAKLAQLDAAIPLQRMARPEEIASVVGFFAGEGASYLTPTTNLCRWGHHAQQRGSLTIQLGTPDRIGRRDRALVACRVHRRHPSKHRLAEDGS
jgi:hypothetical protein